MDTLVTPTAYTPGITTVGRPDGTVWSSAGPAEAALHLSNAVGVARNASGSDIGFNAVRDDVNRAKEFGEIMAELRCQRDYTRFNSQPVDVKAAIDAAVAQSEVNRLRQELSDQKITGLLAAILAKLTPTP